MYPHVFVAGTFDTLHKGHEAFLSHAFEIGDRVTIGLTSDDFVRKFKNSGRIYTPFAQRKNAVVTWLAGNDFENRATVVSIDDPYEPASSMGDLDAILVTRDNRGRGEEINRRRAVRGLSELILVEVPLASAEDKIPISSSRIAEGEIDPAGRLTLPDNLRPELVKPLGNVLVGDAIGTSIEAHRNSIIMSVGDVTTKMLLTTGVIPELIVVDFLVARKPFPELDVKLRDLNLFRVSVISGPGYIANEVVEIIQKWSTHPKDKTVIVVSGEEDLLALPAVAYGPEGAVLYYGQPDKGMVEVLINRDKQQEAIALLAKFSVK